jgi:hypothetical protein
MKKAEVPESADDARATNVWVPAQPAVRVAEQPTASPAYRATVVAVRGFSPRILSDLYADLARRGITPGDFNHEHLTELLPTIEQSVREHVPPGTAAVAIMRLRDLAASLRAEAMPETP